MRDWYIDACVLLNLYASDRLNDIVETFGLKLLVTPTVRKEALYVYERVGDKRGGMLPVKLGFFVQSKALILVPALSTEQELLAKLALARNLDDGEAETIAAAVVRGGGVITDDKKAQNILADLPTSLPSLTTAEILHQWSQQKSVDVAELREVLLNIQISGGFEPGRKEPLRKWWREIVAE